MDEEYVDQSWECPARTDIPNDPERVAVGLLVHELYEHLTVLEKRSADDVGDARELVADVE